MNIHFSMLFSFVKQKVTCAALWNKLVTVAIFSSTASMLLGG